MYENNHIVKFYYVVKFYDMKIERFNLNRTTNQNRMRAHEEAIKGSAFDRSSFRHLVINMKTLPGPGGASNIVLERTSKYIKPMSPKVRNMTSQRSKLQNLIKTKLVEQSTPYCHEVQPSVNSLLTSDISLQLPDVVPSNNEEISGAPKKVVAGPPKKQARTHVDPGELNMSILDHS